MTTYVALLRGINVANNLLKMDRIRQLCAELGFANVRTYIQSGNVIFDADGAPAVWQPAIERKLANAARLPVSVLVRTPAELSRIIADNPFLADPKVDRSKLHVTFLANAAGKNAGTMLAGIRTEGDECRVIGQEIYLYCPSGYGRTRLSNQAIEKTLAMKATTRNWNTVNKLNALAAESTGRLNEVGRDLSRRNRAAAGSGGINPALHDVVWSETGDGSLACLAGESTGELFK